MKLIYPKECRIQKHEGAQPLLFLLKAFAFSFSFASTLLKLPTVLDFFLSSPLSVVS